MVGRIYHVGLTVSDIDRSIAFYVGRDFYPDGPAAGMAGRAVFLDRGKMLWA